MPIKVALVSDFYYPFVGGVEIHIKELACWLQAKGLSVIVITHKRKGFVGLRNDHGFPVYYLNIHYRNSNMNTYPTFIFNFNQARRILDHEQVDIVHCQQTSSCLALEFIFFAAVTGRRVVLTEHSLVGVKQVGEIMFNRACRIFLPACSKIIAVSRTTRNNLILRSNARPEQLVVIPNGVSDVAHIRQIRNRLKRPCGFNAIKIVVIGRMTYRRGTDLLIHILPELCRRHPHVEIIIIGDGQKRAVLEKCIQIHRLQRQVNMLGVISDHNQLLEKVAQCDIFLNTPLTESFGIALAEAALLNLHCVSTNVGGVEEAVPHHLLSTAVPEPDHLLNTLSQVINRLQQCPQSQERKLDKSFEYRWEDVADRTIEVYQEVMKEEHKFSKKEYVLAQCRAGNLFEFFFIFVALLLALYCKVVGRPLGQGGKHS